MKTLFLTALAIIAFAANSVLGRLALAEQDIDALGFTMIRLFSGAISLIAIVYLQRWLSANSSKIHCQLRHVIGAGSLLAYAALFSLAYLLLDTATGALLLFASVQITMLLWAVIKGDRPTSIEWLGMVIAIVGLVVLLLPNEFSPSISGSLLMVASGVAWALYTLNGRSAKNPLEDTMLNFSLAVPFAAILCFLYWSSVHANSYGIILAILSGTLSSAVGYSIWYAALPKLTTIQASSVQLLVPVIAAFGGVFIVDELITTRLIIASLMILGGIFLVNYTTAIIKARAC
ncbi:MAG: DMT family transporter [Arenicella sp.]